MRTSFKALCLAAGIAAAALAAGAAHASDTSLVSAADVDQLVNVAKGFGFAELKKDHTGDPKISGMIEGTRYVVLFYGCDDQHKTCKDIQFDAAWSGTKVTAAKVADWNLHKRFGKAFLDSDGDPHVQMDVNLHYGVSEHNLEDTFDWWRVTMKMFKKSVIED